MDDFFEDTILLLFVVGTLALALIIMFPSDGEIPEIPVEDEGYVETTVFLQDQNLQLRHNCEALGMFVGTDQARSIQYGIQGELWERPGSHDLMIDAFHGYDIKVVMARVHGMRGGAFLADLYLKKEDTIFRLDSRPSDAVAIALRADAPIEVSEDLLQEHGRNVC